MWAANYWSGHVSSSHSELAALSIKSVDDKTVNWIDMLPVTVTGQFLNQDDNNLQESLQNQMLLSQRSVIIQSDKYHEPVRRRATIGTLQELSGSANSGASLKQRSKTWYSGLMSGLIGTIDGLKQDEGDDKGCRYKDDFNGSAEDIIKVSIDRAIEFCPRGFRDKLLSHHIKPLRQKMEQENVLIGLVGQKNSGKKMLLGVIQLSDLLQTEMKKGEIAVRQYAESSDQSLLTCCAYMFILSCDDYINDDNVGGLQVLLERDKEIFSQRRLLFLANKFDMHLPLSASASISALSHTTTDTTEFSMYDRFKDIEDITDQIKREVMSNLSDKLATNIPKDCIHPCMLRWAYTARTVKKKIDAMLSESSDQLLAVDQAESAPNNHLCTTHSQLEDSTIHLPLEGNTKKQATSTHYNSQHSEDTLSNASDDYAIEEPVEDYPYIVDYDSDDVPVNHNAHSDFSQHSQHAKPAHDTIDTLQDWWNVYQPLTDADDINQLPLEEKIEFASGIETIEKWISRHCHDSQLLKQMSVLSDAVYCLQCCSEVQGQELDQIISRIEKLQCNLQQKEQQYCDIMNEYRLLKGRMKDANLFENLMEAYERDIEDALLIVEEAAEDLLKEFKLMCQQKIDKMKMCHVQWETSSIQSILKPLQKDIQVFSKLCEMHLQSATKRVAFPRMYYILPLSTTKTDLKNLHEMAEMYTFTDPIHYEPDTCYPATPEVDHSGVYCLEMFSQANDKWHEDIQHHLFAILYLESANYLPHHPKNNSETRTPNNLELHEKEFKAILTKELESEIVKRKVVQYHLDEYNELMRKYLADFDTNCLARMNQAKEEVIKEIEHLKNESCTTEFRLKHLINLKVYLELHRAALY